MCVAVWQDDVLLVLCDVLPHSAGLARTGWKCPAPASLRGGHVLTAFPSAPTPCSSQALRGTKEVQALVEALGIDASNVAVVLTQVGACSRGVCTVEGSVEGVQLADVQRRRCGGAHAGKLGGVRSGIPPRNIAKCV